MRRIEQPLPEGMCRAARFCRIWMETMKSAGFGDMCDCNPQFNYISYNYTTDSSEQCRRMGETLWQELHDMFGALKPETDESPVDISRGDLSSITRRISMWPHSWPLDEPVIKEPQKL